MKTALKWILGIGIGLVVVAALVTAGFMIFSHRGSTGWMMDTRSGWLWHDDQSTPWDSATGNQDHWKMMPGYRMPRSGMPGFGLPLRPFLRMSGVYTGLFFPLRFIAMPLLCLGFLGLLVLGGVALVVNSRRKQKPATAQTAPTPVVSPASESAPTVIEEPESAKPAAEIRTCGNCGREAEAEWGHCPYCGSALG